MTSELYSVLLWLHSWNRWIIFALAVFVLLRSLSGWLRGSQWTKIDDRSGFFLVLAADLQLVMGLAFLAGVSPLMSAALSNMGATMKDPVLRFFSVEHSLMMVLALVAIHVGRVRARKAPNARRRHRITAISLLLAVLFICAGMPWPSKLAGRPLFRMGGEAASLETPANGETPPTGETPPPATAEPVPAVPTPGN